MFMLFILVSKSYLHSRVMGLLLVIRKNARAGPDEYHMAIDVKFNPYLHGLDLLNPMVQYIHTVWILNS